MLGVAHQYRITPEKLIYQRKNIPGFVNFLEGLAKVPSENLGITRNAIFGEHQGKYWWGLITVVFFTQQVSLDCFFASLHGGFYGSFLDARERSASNLLHVIFLTDVNQSDTDNLKYTGWKEFTVLQLKLLENRPQASP